MSLYEKEEIPLEPGTVWRSRREIEERQRWVIWCQLCGLCVSLVDHVVLALCVMWHQFYGSCGVSFVGHMVKFWVM